MKRYEVRDSVIAVFFTRREAHAMLVRSHRHTGIKDSKDFEKAVARLAVAMESEGEAIENIPANVAVSGGGTPYTGRAGSVSGGGE